MSVGSPTAGTWSSSQWRPDNEFETDRRRSQLAHQADEVCHVIALVGPQRAASPRRPVPLVVHHPGRRLPFGVPVGARGHRVGDQPVPILDQQVSQVRQPRLRIVRPAIQPRVRVGGRGMCVVLARLPAKVAAVPARPAAVLPLKTLLTGPRLDERAVDREMLVRHQPLGAVHHPSKEAASDRLVQQAVAVLRKHRRIPDGLVQFHPDAPAEQQVVVQLLH